MKDFDSISDFRFDRVNSRFTYLKLQLSIPWKNEDCEISLKHDKNNANNSRSFSRETNGKKEEIRERESKWRGRWLAYSDEPGLWRPEKRGLKTNSRSGFARLRWNTLRRQSPLRFDRSWRWRWRWRHLRRRRRSLKPWVDFGCSGPGVKEGMNAN